jgi:hypothetical protein
MLQQGLQVIAQYAQPAGGGRRGMVCRGFRHVQMMTPVLVAFIGIDAGGEVLAIRLGEAFCRRLQALPGALEVAAVGAPPMPCSGGIDRSFSCHAARDAECRKLLVLLGDGPAPLVARGFADLPVDAQEWIDAMAGDPQWDVLPVLRAGTTVDFWLPHELQHKNVAFWHADAEGEVLPGVFQRAGLAPEDYRIFISYIRREASELAEQLHDALTRLGFAVFVDRFSVPVGVDFQERLMQELADRGMVLLLHSAGLGGSPWVEDEIATASKYRLGLYVLRLPGVPERADLSPDRSRPIDPAEWDAAARRLDDASLATIVQEIRRVHHEAHQRQLQRLANALIAAVYDPARGAHGCTLQAEVGGLFVLRRPGGRGPASEIPICLTARPPELRDFYHTHVVGQVAGRGRGAIIAPAPFIVAQRQAWFAWLGGLANLRHADEGQLSNTVDQLIAGTF